MADRHRVNPPSCGTTAPVFVFGANDKSTLPPLERRKRTRAPNEPRKIFLQTSHVPSAAGSAYLELSAPPSEAESTLSSASLLPSCQQRSTLKLSATVHFPRPLPRSAASFSPTAHLSCAVKFAPFAVRHRQPYGNATALEHDLAERLRTALSAVVIAERWPKSGVEVGVVVMEGEEGEWLGERAVRSEDLCLVDQGVGKSGVAAASASAPSTTAQGGSWGTFSLLAGCLTVVSAAMVDAGLDGVDMLSGGVAAIVRDVPTAANGGAVGEQRMVLDPCPSEHGRIDAACVVGYLAARDELAEVWIKGDAGDEREQLLDAAVEAAKAARGVLVAAVREGTEVKLGMREGSSMQLDVQMSG